MYGHPYGAWGRWAIARDRPLEAAKPPTACHGAKGHTALHDRLLIGIGVGVQKLCGLFQRQVQYRHVSTGVNQDVVTSLYEWEERTESRGVIQEAANLPAAPVSSVWKVTSLAASAGPG